MSLSNVFDAKFTKLQDILVPLPIFNKVIADIEGTPSAEYLYQKNHSDGSVKDITNEYFVVPYPYQNPVLPMFKAAGEAALNAEQHNKWKQEIATRAWGFVTYAMHYTALQEFDRNPNYGAIVNIISGSMILFDYTCIKDLTIVFTPYQIESVLNDIHRALSVTPDVDKIYGYSKKDWFSRIMKSAYARTMMMYKFSYNKKDALNPNEDIYLGAVNTYGLYPLEESKQLASNVLQKVQEKQKIIITM